MNIQIINVNFDDLTNKDFEDISKVMISSLNTINYYPNNIKEDFIKNSDSEILKTRLKNRDIFLAIYNKKIIWIIWYEKNMIRNLFVHKNYQNKWVWSKLIQTILDKYKGKLIKAHILIDSLNFYKKNWFILNKKINCITDYSKISYYSYECIFNN